MRLGLPDVRLVRLSSLLLPALALAGCMSSGNPMRAVGAPAQQIQPVQQAALQEGTAINVAGAQPADLTQTMATSPEVYTAPANPADIPPPPAIADSRAGGVEQIREKAAVSSGTPTNVFAVQKGATAGMSTAEQEQARAELEAAAKRNASIASGSDAAAKAAAAKKLKLQAQTHYEETLKEIEN
jgi:PBP1b-binding outer membrane lipoprotein LpoB